VALPRCFPTPFYIETILLASGKNQNKSAKKVNIVVNVNHLTFGAATIYILKIKSNQEHIAYKVTPS
jgi:hypothetical protein